jgi:hypothetical protein
MPDDLYERDVLAWSQHQAELLRCLGRGERVNDVDWAHVAEEIEDVGLSELHSVESFLALIMEHLLELHVAPDSQAVLHWRREIVVFQRNALRRFTPSMRQRIDLQALCVDAVDQFVAGEKVGDLAPLPDLGRLTVHQLLREPSDVLLKILSTATPP